MNQPQVVVALDQVVLVDGICLASRLERKTVEVTEVKLNHRMLLYNLLDKGVEVLSTNS